ncbi:retrovirus-related Pol polyprotein from type-2 retrotransposable element R2DM [Trichonephila clavata]|uniref:Retrovirus-related Pol polyprotein from type-2 retrotransposable element R2DM n=1 Tax=Trichonephila clavata TaxID=2740835 RepID=A0A8X6HJD6_TRICU|nr:retrovirus-related Pol polyprotein from type-2 retrotransposable element R2DM [Trichonephila clavata]
MSTGKFTRFADWRFVHPARLNLLPVNGAKQWTDATSKRCRRCGADNETLPHVVNHCKIHSAAWTKRHNAIQERIRKAVAFRGQVMSVNRSVGDTRLRPDIVATIDGKVYIIDITIPFENRLSAFQEASNRKINKYQPIITHFKNQGVKEVFIIPIIVGSLGAWDVNNDDFLRLVATKSYLSLLRKLCVSDSTRWSRDIYIEHMTGHRQFDNEAIVNGLLSHTKAKHPETRQLASLPPSSTDENCLPISLSGDLIQASFPLASIVPCPIDTCGATFATSDWACCLASLQNHLLSGHKLRSKKTYYLCKTCNSGFFEQPSGHPCFVSSGFVFDSAPAICFTHSGPAVDPDPSPTDNDITVIERSVQAVRVKNDQLSPLPTTTGTDISISGSVITYRFPLKPLFVCPIWGCPFRAKTKAWYATNNSLKRHLKISHKKQHITVLFFCSLCNASFRTKPSAHPCLIASGLMVPQETPSAWDCRECGNSFPTKVGLDNHLLAHKKEAIKRKEIPVKVPPPTRLKKIQRKARIQQHAIGEPAAAPLAAPMPSANLAIMPPVEVEPLPLIDLPEGRVLSSFVEPLNSFLTHDDLPGAIGDFFNIIDDIVAVVRDHFRIRPIEGPTNNEIKPRRRELDLLDPQAVQKCYAWNRRKFVRHLTGENSDRCKIPTIELTNHFSTTWDLPTEAPNLAAFDPPDRPPVVHAFTPKFVASCLQSAENSAPGPDGIMYRQWREVDPGCKILCAVFNVCLRLCKVPPSWKISSTILIHKSGDHDDVTNWRPIALSNTLYKLFTKCMTRKLAEWCEDHEVFSNAQKGFTPYDGVIEHNFLLSQHFENARAGHSESLAAWIDISNAFGSIPHDVILHALRTQGVDHDFVSLVADIYHEATTCLLTEEGPSPPISIRRGVKQGCPLSGILFNLALNDTLKRVQGPEEEKKILAFADDLVLLAKNREQLQDLLDCTWQSLQTIHLEVNPAKCASLHLSGSTPVGSRPSPFTIGDCDIKTLEDGEFTKYLGKPVGFRLAKDCSSINDALSNATKISASKLSPWQKLDALKSFFFPSLNFAMRTAQFPKSDWLKVQQATTREIKDIMSLPSRASVAYIFGERAQGGCGVPEATRDSDFYLIDTAFKLLTSRDEEILVKALGQLIKTTRHRLKAEPSNDDLASFLSGSMEGKFDVTINAIQNTWTLARSASRRQSVTWSFAENQPSVSINGMTVTGTYRKKLLKTLHKASRQSHIDKLLSMRSQGKAMECVAAHPASSHFMSTGKFTRFADWRFVHPARLNLLPVNGAKQWTDATSKRCRRCGADNETLPHVVNHCKIHSAAWTKRHNAIQERIRKAVAFRGQVMSVNRSVGDTRLRPDIVATIDGKVYIIDITIPFENRLSAFQEASNRKINKYQPIITHFKNQGVKEVFIIPIIVGSLGAWDVNNDDFLRLVATKSYLSLLRKLCVSDSTRWSRDIYIEHMTGHRQFDNEAIV